MEQTYNIPIQMFSVCSTGGNLTPVRFRFENEDHAIETIQINRILSHKDTSFNGIHEIQYTCQAEIGGMLRLFTIIYNINYHKWRLFQMLI